jgi:NitT/TauT family transport system ATP-binding protein
MRVELRDVRKTFTLPGGGLITVLDGIDLILEKGGRSLVFGPSGSGKTTLMNIIGGTARATAGRILRDGIEQTGKVALHPSLVSHAFQEPVFVSELTVMENLLLPALGGCDRTIVERGEKLLDEFGLAEMFDLFPRDLSGGERHRLNLARALLFPPACCSWTANPPMPGVKKGWN